MAEIWTVRDHAVSTADNVRGRQCVRFRITLPHCHFIKFVPVTLILETLGERVLFTCDTYLGIEKISEKEINSEVSIPQVTVVPYFSMVLICALFSGQ